MSQSVTTPATEAVQADVPEGEASAPMTRAPTTRARFANVLRPLLRPSEIAKKENPDVVTVGGAAIAIGLVGLGAFMLHEFFAAGAAASSVASSVKPRPVPAPTPRIPIPMPVAPRVRLGVGIADGRAHFTSFDTGTTRAVISASGRSVTIVTTVTPVEIDLHVTEQALPIAEVQLNDTTEVLGEAASGHALSFEVAEHSASMDDPSVQFNVRHQVDETHTNDDLLQIFVLSP